MKVYRSKVDWWVAAILLLSVVIVAWVAALLVLRPPPGGILLVGVVLAAGLVLPIWVLARTRYTIDPPSLLIESGPVKLRIPIAQITKVEPTRSPLSSPALSLDRLRLHYGDGKTCMISPRDRDDFVRELHRHGATAI